jgi:hypothetical protein
VGFCKDLKLQENAIGPNLQHIKNGKARKEGVSCVIVKRVNGKRLNFLNGLLWGFGGQVVSALAFHL